MKIVVTTPTGNIGSKLSELLLDAGQELTLIARDSKKVAALAERGAKVIEGSHADPEVMKTATRGADALFFIAPPNFGSEDLVADYRVYAEAAAEAISANQIPYVVHLSSVGADVDGGNGPILGLHHNEKILGAAAKNIVQLRPAYFMENSLMQVASVKESGNMFTTFKGDTRFPMIATADIAAGAAELLLNPNWEGEKIVELQGAADISYDEIATELSSVLGKPITHMTISKEQFKEGMVQMGGSAHMGELLAEITEGVESGHITFHQARDAKTSTPTSYRMFAETVFKNVLEYA